MPPCRANIEKIKSIQGPVYDIGQSSNHHFTEIEKHVDSLKTLKVRAPILIEIGKISSIMATLRLFISQTDNDTLVCTGLHYKGHSQVARMLQLS